MAAVNIIFLSLYLTSVFGNDVRMGINQPESRQIYSEIWEANPALWVRTEEVIVNATGNDVISAIDVTDLRDDKDGEAVIKSGGVCQKSVVIDLKSPSVLRGYRFRINVYAFDPNTRYYTKGYNSNPCSTSVTGSGYTSSGNYYDAYGNYRSDQDYQRKY